MKNWRSAAVLSFLGLVSINSYGLSVGETVKFTLQTNPEVLAALNERRSIEYEVRGAKAGYLPQVSVSAAVGHERRTAPVTGNEEVDFDRRELGIQARQMIFDGFATKSEVARQRARYETAGFELQATANSVALRATEVYLNVLEASELLDLARESLWEHQNIFDQMKLRRDTGVGSKADLDQIMARLALANSNMVVAQNNFADAQTSFHRVTGLFPNLENMTKPFTPETFSLTREAAVKMALEGHPTLKAAVWDVKEADAQYRASSAPKFPRLSLEADKRWDENVGLEGEDEDLVVSLRLTYDIYAGGANKARKKQTAALVAESKDIRNNSRRQVIESMQLAWNAYDALTTQKGFLQQHVDAAVSTKEAYSKQFNIGRRTLLDLLNTENEVIDSKRSLISAEYDRTFAIFRIRNATGNIIESLGINLEF